MTTDDVAEAQELAAQLHASGAPITLEGAPHSAKRLMFYHGATTGHASCACPVVDEHGHNVNPGREPLERKAAGRAEGSRKASETFARQRARRCADELALIAPALWDDHTRGVISTLATMAAPSRIDDPLDEAFGVSNDELERIRTKLEHEGELTDIREVFALEVARMTPCPATAPVTGRPCVLDRGHPGQHVLEQEPMHDNGDYRA